MQEIAQVQEGTVQILQAKIKMKIFYLTFGQKNTALRNGWMEVEAEGYFEAVEIVRNVFGSDWANLYREEEFQKETFPLGKIGETLK
jgi:hypothetical protein